MCCLHLMYVCVHVLAYDMLLIWSMSACACSCLLVSRQNNFLFCVLVLHCGRDCTVDDRGGGLVLALSHLEHTGTQL